MAGRRRQVVWSPSARRALDEAAAYIAEDSADAAIRVVNAVLEAADSLSEFSERGRVVPELDESSIRELLVYRYRLIYQVRENEVSVVTLLHGARDFENWRRRRR